MAKQAFHCFDNCARYKAFSAPSSSTSLLKDEVEEEGAENDNDAIVVKFKDRAIDWFRKPFEEREGEEGKNILLLQST